jgi:hypothetical protein
MGVQSLTFASTDLGEKTANSLEALEKADKYSFGNAGVGVLIAYGSGNAMSADQIGEAFVKEIQKRGQQGRYYYYLTDGVGVAMEFYMGYATMGPWNSDEAAANMSKIVRMMQAAKNVHSGQVNL